MIDPRLARSVRMTMRAVLVTVVLALAAAGCGGDEQSAPASGGAAPSGERLTGPLKFLVTGGDAFRKDRITVQPDGTADVETLAGRRRSS